MDEALTTLDSVAAQVAELNDRMGGILPMLADVAEDRLIKGYAGLARLLDVKTETARRIAERGEIPTIRYGGGVYFRRGDVFRYRPSGHAAPQAWTVTLDERGLTFRRGAVVAEWSTRENRVRIRRGSRVIDTRGTGAYASPEDFMKHLNNY